MVKSCRRNIRGYVRKYNMFAWHLKGMPVDEALIQMRFARSRRSYEFFSLLRNAQANAVHQYGMNPDTLIIDNLRVLRAHQPKVLRIRGKGGSMVMRLRHSHLICRVKENAKLTNKAWRGIGPKSDTKVMANDTPVPHIVVN
ncbi:ribosomal protein L22 [Reticulomyxa filosa]|uniref:Ribosomal protein L22 n=1 Tax=Reticulomyxa filosa TaxID=46433 RepID=X6MDX0_RETFI|nr:ribosomal protein L22 [Reticulomyxa filosa]|eukprot:ETO11846.1 ribosomal protein L22 [Reticulomyxa filosa]